ncbi:MAG: pilus assembly protein [Planctomycetaceae bacterium]|nr:pilus assembly protein [Planctomycetaceae bacterium]
MRSIGLSQIGQIAQRRRPMRQTTGQRRTGAILSMELVLILPIFLTLIFGIIELSMLTSARSRVHDAARQGARLMSMSGPASEDQVRQLVGRMLGNDLRGRAQVSVHPGRHAGDVGSVVVTVPMSAATPDFLWMVGFSVRNRSLQAAAPAIMECDTVVATAETSGVRR